MVLAVDIAIDIAIVVVAAVTVAIAIVIFMLHPPLSMLLDFVAPLAPRCQQL